MGFDGAVNTLARVVSPLVFGEIYRIGCCQAGRTCVYTAVSIALFRRWLVLRRAFVTAQTAADANTK